MRVKPFVRFLNYSHMMPTRYNLDVSDKLSKIIPDDSLTDREKAKAVRLVRGVVGGKGACRSVDASTRPGRRRALVYLACVDQAAAASVCQPVARRGVLPMPRRGGRAGSTPSRLAVAATHHPHRRSPPAPHPRPTPPPPYDRRR